MSGHRGTSNRNGTGNSYDRRRRRAWMIETFGIPRHRDGRKTRIRCVHCSKLMRAHGRRQRRDTARFPAGSLRFTWEVDRIVCGHDGGRYVRSNLQVSCPRCNQTRCSKACRFGASQASTRSRRRAAA